VLLSGCDNISCSGCGSKVPPLQAKLLFVRLAEKQTLLQQCDFVTTLRRWVVPSSVVVFVRSACLNHLGMYVRLRWSACWAWL